MMKRVLFSLANLLAAAGMVSAAGGLDSTFGNAGRVVTSFPGGFDTANGVAVQTDGKIVVAGSSGSDFALTRYNTDGTLDMTFGTGGRVHTDFPVGQGGFGAALVIQPDGKIVVAGAADDPATDRSVFALARYNSDGTLDLSFDGDGLVVTPFTANNASANAIARQSDGKLVLAGVSTDATNFNSVFALARYNPDGSLDTTFDGDGRVTTDFPGFTFEQARVVAVQADGKIVAAGQGSSSFALARYNPDGTPDLSFDMDGMVTTAFGGTFEVARALAIQADQKIIAAGLTALSVASEDNFALARYNTDGSLDMSFDGDGRVITDFGLVDGANAVVIQADGRIVAAGAAGTIPAGSFFALARYNTDGTLDNNFDLDGKVLTDLSGGRFGLGAAGVALQADGRIVAAGDANISGQRDFGVARYNTNGSLDTSFDGDGTVLTDFALNEDAVAALLVQPDGKIIAAGRAQLRIRIRDTQDPNFQLARYNPDGTLDATFGAGGIVTTDFLIHGDDIAHAAALQSDGRIIVVGQVGENFSVSFTSDTAFGIARYNADGALDTSFDGDGLVTIDFGPTHDGAFAVAVQADGKIVVGGSNASDFALARLNSNGSLDTTGFGIAGRVITDFGGGFESASALLIQPNGQIVAAGSSAGNFALVRYNTDGNLDLTGFGVGGRVTTDFSGGDDALAELIIQPDGKLVAAGSATNPGTGSDFALARYNTDGTLDMSGFGSGGRVTTDFGGFDSAGGLTLLADGRLATAGLFFTGSAAPTLFAVAIYHPNGSLDSSVGSGNGRFTTDFFGIDNQANAIAVQSDGKIVVGGLADTGSSLDFALARYVIPFGAQLLNISTRGVVMDGDKVLIGGFMLLGDEPKQIVIRGLGPSLNINGTPIPERLANPTLRLMQGSTELERNDSWRSNEGAVQATGLAPSDDAEAAIVRTLAPGNYTAILSGEDDTTGIGLVEIYDVQSQSVSRLGNISTRGMVETGDRVLIGGFIIGAPATSGNGARPAIANGLAPAGETARVIVRAIGPSMNVNGTPVPERLADPRLTLHDGNGTIIESNDNWTSDQQTEIEETGLAPGNDLESAIVRTLLPGNYTAIVRGNGDTTGIGLVEVFHLPFPQPATQ